MLKTWSVGTLAGLLALALLACGDDDRTAAERTDAPQPEAEAPPTERQTEFADVRELERFRLTMDQVRRFADAYQNLHRLEETDPQLQRRLDALAEAELEDTSRLEDIVSVLESEPQVRAAIRDAGLTTHQFVLVQTTLFQAYMLLMMEEAGMPAPPDVSGVSEQHLEFVRQNRDAIDAEMQRIQDTAPDDDG